MPKMPEAEKKEESAESIEEKKEQVGAFLSDIFKTPRLVKTAKCHQNLASGNLNC